jgi:hypothetical protein
MVQADLQKNVYINYLCVFSQLVVNFLRPLALRAAITLRPFAVAMRNLKPCLLILLRRDG